MTNTQQQIASSAASLIYEEGYDYYAAKQKASLGFADHDIPKNIDIHTALLHYVKTTAFEENAKNLPIQQQIVVEAMQFLADYEPCLVGALTEGVASPYATLCLHLFASTHEEVMFFLDANSIPYQMDEATLKMANGFTQYPCIRFLVDDTELELVIFPNERSYKVAPISSVTEKAMQRFSLKKFQKLMDNSL